MTRSASYILGRLAGKQFRKAKWIWESVAGDENAAIRAEQGVGRDMATVVREQANSPIDRDAQALLDEITTALVERVQNPVYQFEVTAIAGDHPTAFALPGGFIFVAPSLVNLANRDTDELAFVIAHEMAHVMRRHAIDRLLGQKALSAVSLATPTARTIAPWLRTVGFRWLEKAYSREQEFEADELGGRLMHSAGFNLQGAIRILDRFRDMDHQHDPLGLRAYLSTHPPVDDRIQRLQIRLKIGN